MNHSRRLLTFSCYSFVIAAFGVLVFATGANAASISWDGGGDGSTWESANNWSGDSVPDTADDVTIDANVTLTISAGDTVGSLTMGNAGGTTSPTLQFNYASITGTELTVTNDLIMYSGSDISHTTNTTTQAYDIDITVGGNMTINSGATINLDALGYDGGPSAGNNGSGPGAGTTANYSGGGGSHGGDGGDAAETSSDGGVPYGVTLNPVTIGSGGAAGLDAGTTGGGGGGGVRLIVTGTFTLDGAISANGDVGVTSANGANGGGGGAGGGVNIVAGVFSCTDGSSDGCDTTPTITANGGTAGDGTGRDGGGGSGGRIYLRYGTSTMQMPDDYEAIFSAIGGDADPDSDGAGGSSNRDPEDGDSGSVIILDEASDTSEYTDADAWIISGFFFADGDHNDTGNVSWHFNDLYISGIGNSGVQLADLTFETAASILDVDGTLTMMNTDMDCASVSTLQIDAGTLAIGGGSAGSTDVESIEDCGNLSINVSGGVTSPWDGLTLSSDSIDLNIVDNESLTLTDSSITATDYSNTALTIDDAISLTLGFGDGSNSTTITSNLTFDVTDVTVYQGSSISANELGCLGRSGSGGNGYGPDGSNVCTITTTGYGDAASYAGGGAGHGGLGGTTVDGAIAGATYDVPGTPSGYRFGSSGAGGEGVATSGNGGGYIEIDASNSVVVNGSITANGGDGDDHGNNGAGGGSGGSIWIVTGSLAGTATAGSAFQVSGGIGGTATGTGRGGGGGGGGLIYLDYATDDSTYLSGVTDANTAAKGAGGTGTCCGGGNGGDGFDGVVTQNDRVPTYVSSVYEDDDNDGTIDQIVLTFSETVTLGGTLSSTRFAWVSSSGSNGFAGSLSGNATASGTDVTVVLSSADADETGHVTVPTIAYDDNSDDATDKIQDAGGGIVQTFTAENVDDGAGPVLVSSSPTDAEEDVATDATVVLTFSETMDTGVGFTYSCCGAGTDPGRSGAWSVSDTVYTITPSADWTNSEDITIDITGAPDAYVSQNNFAGVVSGMNDPFTFTIAAEVSGGTPTPGTGPAAVVTTAMMITPNGAEILQGNQAYSITWLASGDNLDSISIYYSSDNGHSYGLIAGDEPNDGSYTWTVPNETIATAKIRVDAVTSSGGVLIDDESNASFSITASDIVIPPEPETAEPELTGPVLAEMTAPAGEVLDIREGSLFRGVELSGVYLVKDGTRYVFPSEAVFLSRYADFSGVVQVDDDQLRELPFGGRMTMAEGSLIKIQSDNRVYVVLDDIGTITHIPDEETAISTYGADWAQLVHDISVVFWFDYTLDM
ncbi:Ig-like domain-containing protein [Candidatus Uhrbacteria bacterium]|jgi:hypothetical protein|nr:Ig-like domain-containing protein [Candidatus Uhrbacteria bacterium]